jgi:hypothetical protein
MLVFQNSTGHKIKLVTIAISIDECITDKNGKYIFTQLLQNIFMNNSGISSHTVAAKAFM